MQTIDPLRVRRSFDAQAHEYDRHAIVQKRVLDRFLNLLPVGLDASRILDIGSGTGALLKRLAGLYPGTSLIGADMAFGMGIAAREAIGEKPGITFVTADAEHLPFADSSFDVVVSTSTFQWLESLAPSFIRIRQSLSPGGRFCFALFGSKTLFELRDSYRIALAELGKEGLDRTHSFKDVEYVGTALRLAGFEVEYLASELEVEIHPDVPHLLRSIRRIGAGNAAPGSGRTLAERRIMLLMMEHYQNTFGGPEGIPATYEVIYGTGRTASQPA